MHQATIAYYAPSPPRRRLPLSEYLFLLAIYCFSFALAGGVLLLVLGLNGRAGPAPTPLLLKFYRGLVASQARYWFWLLPVLMPLLPQKLRFRVAGLTLLLASLALIWFAVAFLPRV